VAEPPLAPDRTPARLQAALSWYVDSAPITKKLDLAMGGLLASIAIVGGCVLWSYVDDLREVSAYRTATRANVAAEEAVGEFTALRIAAFDYHNAVASRDSIEAARQRERIVFLRDLTLEELRMAREILGDDPLAARLAVLPEQVLRYHSLIGDERAEIIGQRHEVADRLSFEINSIADLLTARRDALGPHMQADAARGFVFLAIVLTLLLSAGASLLFVLRRSIAAPIARLARAIAEDDAIPEAMRARRDEIGQLAAAASDYRERKKAQGEEEIKRRAAQAASDAKTRFVATISHELRTPLNAIINYAEMIEEEPAAGSTGEDAAKIAAAGRHLLSLINDVLDISKIEAGRLDLAYEKVDVEALVQIVCDMCSSQARARNNVLHCMVDPSVATLLTDGMRLRQCLINLVSNAIKFTENGRVTVSALPAWVDGRPGVEFAVVDTGIGVAAEKQIAIFEPFVQADQAHAGVGSGLGLAISKELAEALGGKIGVTSAPNKGSTFAIKLPLTRAA
jgi:signal transduction histidine kinase